MCVSAFPFYFLHIKLADSSTQAEADPTCHYKATAGWIYFQVGVAGKNENWQNWRFFKAIIGGLSQAML